MEKQNRTIGKCRIVKNEYQEYVVKCWDTEDKRYHEADYFTDSKYDAELTMQAMLNPVCDFAQYLKNERR